MAITSITQTVVVAVSLVLLVQQVGQATEALRRADQANRLQLSTMANDIILAINQTVLEHPDLDDGMFSRRDRLMILRLTYFDRVHRIYESGLLDHASWEAEAHYLRSVASDQSFVDLWTRSPDGKPSLRLQYRESFREWVESTLDVFLMERAGKPVEKRIDPAGANQN